IASPDAQMAGGQLVVRRIHARPLHGDAQRVGSGIGEFDSTFGEVERSWKGQHKGYKIPSWEHIIIFANGRRARNAIVSIREIGNTVAVEIVITDGDDFSGLRRVILDRVLSITPRMRVRREGAIVVRVNVKVSSNHLRCELARWR